MATCATCGAPVPEAARFCPTCAAPVGSDPDQSERKLATVVFADLVGSTALGGSQDPERTRAMLERFYDAMAAEIETAGGTVEKFAGDAVMDRILHGIRAVEDEALILRLASSGVCLDVCPSSNVLLGVVPDMDSHPLPAFSNAGVRCSLNADDPLLFGVGILDEFVGAREQMLLDDDDLAMLARSSLEASAAPPPIVAAGLRSIDEWLAAWTPTPSRRCL
jgi:hypothetical protein